MTITEFLLARIAEDEACANNARGLLGVETAWYEVDVLRQRGLTRADAQHVARWSSARVLAECRAKLRIVERAGHVRVSAATLEDPDATVPGPAQDVELLRILAAVYADHPDYDPAWAM